MRCVWCVVVCAALSLAGSGCGKSDPGEAAAKPERKTEPNKGPIAAPKAKAKPLEPAKGAGDLAPTCQKLKKCMDDMAAKYPSGKSLIDMRWNKLEADLRKSGAPEAEQTRRCSKPLGGFAKAATAPPSCK